MKRVALPVVVLLAVALLLLGVIPREPEADRAWMATATTYSPGPRGSKALFLLFGSAGLSAKRLRRATYDQLSPETVLWVLTREPFGRAERPALVRFLKSGGTVVAPPQALAVVLEEAGLGKAEPKEHSEKVATAWGLTLELEGRPSSLSGVSDPTESYATTATGRPIVAAWGIAKGRAVSLGADDLVRNDRIGRAGNGPFLTRLAFLLGKKHVFDEWKTGFGEGDLATLLTRVPYRWGIAQLALVGALGLFSFARRRVPAEPPMPVRRRRTLDHVEAVAQLWERAKDAGLPLQAILSAVAERARARLGGAGGERPFTEWIARVRPALLPRATRAWERAERLCKDARPPIEEARACAADLKTLEQEAAKW